MPMSKLEIPQPQGHWLSGEGNDLMDTSSSEPTRTVEVNAGDADHAAELPIWC